MTMRFMRTTSMFMCVSLAAGAAAAAEFPAPLQSDTPLKVEKLPAKYPTGWAFLNYAGDRVELRNVGADSREVKAQLQAHDSATLLVSEKRPEIYVADTVWSRGVRGTRTDFITIYDSQTMNVAGEIVLPGTKRALITAMEGLLAFTDDQRMALVFNFTPAASVTVVDLVKRQPLGEIEIPGCSLVYPSGERGFSTLCSSGTLLTCAARCQRRRRRTKREQAVQSTRYRPVVHRQRLDQRRALLSESARTHPADRYEDR